MSYPKRVMVVGNGGRECALACAMLESRELEELIITPPNWGLVDPVGGRVRTLGIKATALDELVTAAKEHSVDLVVIGPEAPLCAGLADMLRSEGIAVLGPGKEASQLEGSKSFAKDFMQRCGIPTADFMRFTDHDSLAAYVNEANRPLVIKEDGLAGGKGVYMCPDADTALAAANDIFVEQSSGRAVGSVVVEEWLGGPEISFTCLIAGGRAEVLPPSSDYKRLDDNDEGPNTGGMGNMCPTPYATDEVIEDFAANILSPFMHGLREDGLDYRGFLFVGTMLTDEGLRVLEFNVRFGDPEAQVVLPLCKADWPALFGAMANGELPEGAVELREGACVAVVLASGNYPYSNSEPAVIEGLDRVQARGLLDAAKDDAGEEILPPVRIYFAGVGREASADANGDAGSGYSGFTNDDASRYMATGGRVLAVSAYDRDLSLARRLAYEVVGNLHFEGMKFRTDIAKLR